MGLPGLTRAQADSRYRPVTLSQMAATRSKLDQGLENVNLCVLGDSTGVGNGLGGTDKRWTYRLAERLAARYPTYTVRWKPWNPSTPGYDSFVTVQTGTGTGNAGGPFTIDIYNGSASGQSPSYSQTNLLGTNGLIPYGVVPDLIFVNHSHNMATAVDTLGVNKPFYGLIRDALRWYNPLAGMVVIGQNPAVLTTGMGVTASPQQHQQRQSRLKEMCASEGWGFIDVNRAFLDNPNWVAQLVKPDGTHPNDAGSELWAKTVWDTFIASERAQPVSVRPVSDSIVIPASAFIPTLAVSGTLPAAAVLGSPAFLPTLGFSKAAGVIGATAVISVPISWRYVSVWVDWCTSDGVAGNVAWQTDISYQNRVQLETASVAGSAALAMTTGSSPTIVAAPTTALAEAHTLISGTVTTLGWVAVPSGTQIPRRLFMRVGRSGANGSDTYAGIAHLLQVRIERAA